MADKTPLEFSVPYNSDPGTLEEIFRLKELNGNAIAEVYLSGPQIYSGSGRAAPAINLQEFTDVVDKIHARGLRVNLALNSTCEGTGWYSQDTLAATINYLQDVYDEHGLDSVTIANPLYISAVRRRFPDIQICASVLSEIDCVQRALHYVDAGADVIVPDVNVNRNLALLKDIEEATGARLRLLVNEGCLYKCPFRMFHFNAMSHASKEVDNPDLDMSFGNFFGACSETVAEDPSEIFRSCWVRPEDTRKYAGITNFFKISGRAQPKSMVARVIRAYLEERWDGDLLDLLEGACRKFSYQFGGYIDNRALDSNSFFGKVTGCSRDCLKCGYCAALARDIVQVGKRTPEKAADLEGTR